MLPSSFLIRRCHTSRTVEARWAAGAISQKHAQRLWGLMPYSVQTLVNSGPDLVDIFIPGSALVRRAEKVASGGTDWLSQFKQLVARQEAR